MENNHNVNLHKEIDLIQACISRMAHNSFLIKGWAISIIVIGFALLEKKVEPWTIGLIMLIPLISFWWLDSFFLFIETRYRALYNWVIIQRPLNNIDHLYNLNPHRSDIPVKNKRNNKDVTQLSVMFSKTLIPFYLVPLITVIIIATSLQIQKGTSKVKEKVTLVKIVKKSPKKQKIPMEQTSIIEKHKSTKQKKTQ